MPERRDGACFWERIRICAIERIRDREPTKFNSEERDREGADLDFGVGVVLRAG
jgi:hypothetical protein